MSNTRDLEDVVREVVDNFVATDQLFTALDVSKEVKKTLPFARHSEIRDIVRSLYATVIQAFGYGRTPIDVVLMDGTKSDALLYHPLADSWDLDAKYDAQKRSATSQSAPAAPVVLTSTAKVMPAPSSQPLTVQSSDPKELWKNLFGSADLFPTS